MLSGIKQGAMISKSRSAGADDYIYKKLKGDKLCRAICNAHEVAQRKRCKAEPSDLDIAPLRRQKKPKFGGETLEGIYRRIPRLIDSAVSAVHIFGESGTGKEVVAELFRYRLPAKVPLITCNCAAIPPELIESELFGHVKGAFTGAIKNKTGKIELASGGWLFLDEVGTLTPETQAKLLRALDNGEIQPVGAENIKKVSFKVLSATNEDIPKLVVDGKFRQDFWQRIGEAKITLPPLRERSEEIAEIAVSICKKLEGGPYKLADEALSMLCSLKWKDGNIRELRNCIRTMTELHQNKLLTVQSIPEEYCRQSNDDEKPALSVANIEPKRQSLGISWQNNKIPKYKDLADRLLLELTRHHALKDRRLSLRKLVSETGVSRNSLVNRFSLLVHNQVISKQELFGMVGRFELKAVNHDG